jgi:hypothetical protein
MDINNGMSMPALAIYETGCKYEFAMYLFWHVSFPKSNEVMDQNYK